MTPLVNHFVSGRAFFSGTVFILLAICLSSFRAGRIKRLTIFIAGICGMLLVVFSSTPLPTWFYVGWIIVVAAVIAVRQRWILIAAATIITCTAIVWQLLYYLPPRLPTHPDDTMYLIGDSISAGIGNRDIICWPKLIQRDYRVKVV